MIDILLVEDNRSVAMALRQATALDYNLTLAQNGLSGIKLSLNNKYDAIILDLNLPDISGLEVCQQLRAAGDTTPILILSGEDKIMSKIHLLDAGANDYLTKPFSIGELKVRLRVLLRDNQSLPTPLQILKVGDLSLDPNKHIVERNGLNIELRKKEFLMLECLMSNVGKAVSRTDIGNYAWDKGGTPWTNTIDVHIKHLRDKVDRGFSEPLIRTIHGVGYRIDDPKPLLIRKA